MKAWDVEGEWVGRLDCEDCCFGKRERGSEVCERGVGIAEAVEEEEDVWWWARLGLGLR